ncbi:flavodoxin family protein [Tissierella pigra]|uniref:flavodoxin family protein n=1 Tax=Tissierella pigra TaxID=2607614 RepID=UPI001C12391F|nr:flavodoxin family protein [Tissierella pigra]MBU5425372.1 flavodoxin family protein [Tissierella pigra]
MKTSIVYSSLTGNTKKVADEILKIMPEGTEIYDLKDLNHSLDDELLILGYWVDKANPNKEMYQFMESLKGKKIITFGTLGAYPDSSHAKEVKENTVKILEKNNEVLGTFLCQGKINPKITEMFMKNGGENNVHTMTPERLKRHEDAAKHPNEEDFSNARSFVKDIINSL